MGFLTVLGFLGLSGVAALIVIYIIRPNYQQKLISSTFVWKLSLKYKRKRIPINKIRNLLIFICQVLIITAATIILTQPYIAAAQAPQFDERIVILDASASMRAEDDKDVTRFERAIKGMSGIEGIKDLGSRTINAGGRFSIILAGAEASVVISRTNSLNVLYDELNILFPDYAGMVCGFGDAAVDEAILLAEEIMVQAPNAEVLFYTDADYLDDGGIKVVNVSDRERDKDTKEWNIREWNAAILDVVVETIENILEIKVDVAAYGRSLNLKVDIEINGANAIPILGMRGETIRGLQTKFLTDDQADFVYFDYLRTQDGDRLFSFESIYVKLDVEDSFSYDNTFYVYGGEGSLREHIRIQYYSNLLNPFVESALFVLQDNLRAYWDIEIILNNKTPILEGFDFYIFEHQIPQFIPTDGIVMMISPNRVPEQLQEDLVLGEKVPDNNPVGGDPFYLDAGIASPVMNFINPSEIYVTQYTRIDSYDGFDALMYCGSDPVFLIKNEPDTKVAILSFSLHRSNIAARLEFPTLMYNIFDYFLPPTLRKNIFEVGETIDINARAKSLTFNGSWLSKPIILTEFPAEISVSAPGAYTLTQARMNAASGAAQITERIFVKIPEAESKFGRTEERLKTPFHSQPPAPSNFDILIYLAATLYALLFIEWILSRIK